MHLGNIDTAVTLGETYRIVTPATGAVVLETESDYQHSGLERKMYDTVASDVKAAPGTADGTSTLAPVATQSTQIFAVGPSGTATSSMGGASGGAPMLKVQPGNDRTAKAGSDARLRCKHLRHRSSEQSGQPRSSVEHCGQFSGGYRNHLRDSQPG